MWRRLLAFFIIVLSLMLVKPYLYPQKYLDLYPKQLTAEIIYMKHKLNNGNYQLLRASPLADDPRWISESIPIIDGLGNSSTKIFKIDLIDYFNKSNFKDIYLNVLYYPGLHNVKVYVDNIKTEVNQETFWLRKDNYIDDAGFQDYFHGLKLSGLPDKGMLEVHTTFKGSGVGNWISLISLLLIVSCVVSYIIFDFIKKRRRLTGHLNET
jgi:hypothetical protein